MNICKAFDMDDRAKAYEHLEGLEKLEEYGDYCNGHYLHTWDDGHRYLCRCPECDALILVQFSEFHGMENDSYYKNYFHVSSREEAESLNKQYDGWEIEKVSGLRRIFK